MTIEEFREKLNEIQKMKCETQILELKSAVQGCPKRLYDTLSGFSNQDDGGVIIFGIEEDKDYRETGVYDAQDLQKQINNVIQKPSQMLILCGFSAVFVVQWRNSSTHG